MENQMRVLLEGNCRRICGRRMHQSEEDAGKCQRQNRQEILEELLYRFNGWAGHRRLRG